jgi:hypothetical protein
MSRRVLFAAGLILVAALIRVLPHPHNFAPVGAMMLFGAAYFRRSWGLLIPFIALFLSDLVLNNVVYSAYYPTFKWVSSGWNYLSFAAVFAVGYLMFQKGVHVIKVAGASVSASVVFFLLSNLSTFVETTIYPKTVAGLMACYTAGIPFFANTLVSDLFFSAVLFGAYEWVTARGLVQSRG